MAKRGSKLAKKAKKKGLAPSKMKNIQTLKRIKNKDFTPAEKHARKVARKERKKMTYAELRTRKIKELRSKYHFENEDEIYPLSAEVTGEEMMNMIEQDDLDYLVDNSQDLAAEEEEGKGGEDKEDGEKTPTDEIEEKTPTDEIKEKTQTDEIEEKTQTDGIEENNYEDEESSHQVIRDENGEEIPEYELKERSFNPFGNQVKSLLPFKTKDGLIARYTKREADIGKKGRRRSKVKTQNLSVVTEPLNLEEKKDKGPVEKTVVELMAEREEILENKKVSIGCLAVNFLEHPQERMHCLNTLFNMLDEKDASVRFTVRKYVILSLLKVFHRTIPGYHIVVHDLTEKLKKETKEQYAFENVLLKVYQAYLKELERYLEDAKKDKEQRTPAKQLATVALRCLGELLMKHSHFTYTNNIIASLVPYLNHDDDEICTMVSGYFKTLFEEDISGDVSLEVVKRIDHFVRKRAFKVRIEILSVLLSLRIKDIKSLDQELQDKNTAKKKLTHTEKIMRKFIEEKRSKKSNKEAKRFRKFRKLEEQRKELKLAKKEEVRTSQHTVIVEIMFGLYFHILKKRPNKKLNGIVLEGLAKFSHLVNVEFFSDLLDVLLGLMEGGMLKFRESLHCIQCVFTILSDQGEALAIDPSRFYMYLYSNLFRLSAAANEEDVKSAFVSLIQMLVMRRKRVSHARVQGFVKRLITLSTTLSHHGAISALATARYIMLTHPSSEVLLEMDIEGSCGVFNPEIDEPEHSNAASSTLWELHLMNRHYHSGVRKFAQHLINGAPLQGEGQLPPHLGKRKVNDLYDDFDPATMKFNPAIASASQHITKKMTAEATSHSKRLKLYEWHSQSMKNEIESVFPDGDYLNYDPFDETQSDAPQDKRSVKLNGMHKNKKNGLKNNNNITKKDLDYFHGLLPNMNKKKIQIRDLSAIRDASSSLTDVDHDSC